MPEHPAMSFRDPSFDSARLRQGDEDPNAAVPNKTALVTIGPSYKAESGRTFLVRWLQGANGLVHSEVSTWSC